MEIICCDPICRSLRSTGYSLSITGKLMPSFQKNSSNLSWDRIPVTSPSSLVIRRRWIPLPKTSMAPGRKVSGGSDSSCSGRQMGCMSLSGMASLSLARVAMVSYRATCSSSGLASPTTASR